MTLINKEESEQIRSKFPYAHIARTMKQDSKRHRYYCEESPRVMNYLNELRTDVEVYPSEHN